MTFLIIIPVECREGLPNRCVTAGRSWGQSCPCLCEVTGNDKLVIPEGVSLKTALRLQRPKDLTEGVFTTWPVIHHLSGQAAVSTSNEAELKHRNNNGLVICGISFTFFFNCNWKSCTSVEWTNVFCAGIFCNDQKKKHIQEHVLYLFVQKRS